jgi:predicted nucleic-acid-binding Zn-ribbon protein
MRGPTQCPKCQGSMSEGVIADKGDAQWVIASFLPGAPKVSRWFGLKVRKKDLVPISAWRCGRCGYLESYALSG